MNPLGPARMRGFTLVELLVGIAVASVLLVLAVPNLRDFIVLQRLKGINAQLVTDMQFARSEAAARNQFVHVDFRFPSGGGLTCYAIYTTADNEDRCECDLAENSTCSGSAEIIRTVRVDQGGGVSLRINRRGQGFGFAFDHVTGGIWSTPSDDISEPLALFRVESFIDSSRVMRNDINQAGRLAVCAPASRNVGAAAC